VGRPVPALVGDANRNKETIRMTTYATRYANGALSNMADYRQEHEGQQARLPCNIAAEAALIGAILIKNECIDSCGNLKPEHFFDPLHGRIFGHCQHQIADGKIVNPILLKPYFENDPSIIELGGTGYFAKLTADGSGLVGATQFADQIVLFARLRDLIAVSADAAGQARSFDADLKIEDVVAQLGIALDAISNGEGVKTISTAEDALHDVLSEIELERAGKGIPVMRPTGITAWNDAIDGMSVGDLTILAGRPGMMKTGTALRIALAASLDGIPTDFYSLEMSKRQLITRALSDLAFDDPQNSPLAKHIKTMNLHNRERDSVRRAEKTLSGALLEIDTDPDMTIVKLGGRIRSSKRRWERRGTPLRLVIVDYLQLMSGAGKSRGENRVQELSEISRGLKLLAKSNDVHIVALSQLSRAVEQRDDKRPILSDLRDSGSIEQDADNVVFVYRESYYRGNEPPKTIKRGTAAYDDWEADSHALKNDLDLIARKVRSGEGGTRKFYVSLQHQAIRDPDWQTENRRDFF
jgi:replicative DNA helicase